MFEEPVTESIAPGYFEVVDKPMDYQTVEKKVEEQVYKSKDEVSRCSGSPVICGEVVLLT